MGSKRAMLRNGLGAMIHRELSHLTGFVDLFAGSATVASHVARNYAVPVRAFDIQSFSVVTAAAVVGRSHALDVNRLWKRWLERAHVTVAEARVPSFQVRNGSDVDRMRKWCAEQTLPITKAYGGHYFSALQSVWLDAMRLSVPRNKLARDVAIATLVEVGSQCAASPGHTAQPFQPTSTAIRFIREAWSRDPLFIAERAFISLGTDVARMVGCAAKEDANVAATSLSRHELVFIDPPYSGVHYSRFYHVLETIADGSCGEVSGKGRYPSSDKRPKSKYSLKGHSKAALDHLLETVASASATAILTFPDHECSNGLSGRTVREIAAQHFRVEDTYVAAKFSTLGGAAQTSSMEKGRYARQAASEMLLLLRPV